MTDASDLAAMRPDFSAQRLFLLVTGSVNAALVPHWLHWLRQLYPDLETHVAVTRSAERFVTVEAVRQLVGGQVVRDSWDAVPAEMNHVAIDAMTDCFAVFPATTDSVMRLGSGRCDSPLLMALQATRKPIGVAATFPATNPVIDDVLDRLARRTNVRFAPQVPAYSIGRRSWGGVTGFFLPSLIETLESMLVESRA